MIDWSVCRTRCQKSLPIKAASCSLPEWHWSLLQLGFPWQTSKAGFAQAPVPAEGTFSWCQSSWEQGPGACSDFCVSLWVGLHQASLQPVIKGYSGERKEQDETRRGWAVFCCDAYWQTLKLGVMMWCCQLKALSSSWGRYDFNKGS